MDLLFLEGIAIVFRSSMVLFELNERQILNSDDGAQIFDILKNITISADQFIAMTEKYTDIDNHLISEYRRSKAIKSCFDATFLYDSDGNPL